MKISILLVLIVLVATTVAAQDKPISQQQSSTSQVGANSRTPKGASSTATPSEEKPANATAPQEESGGRHQRKLPPYRSLIKPVARNAERPPKSTPDQSAVKNRGLTQAEAFGPGPQAEGENPQNLGVRMVGARPARAVDNPRHRGTNTPVISGTATEKQVKPGAIDGTGMQHKR